MHNKLKQMRLSRNLTLDDIEKKTGIKRASYNNYENSKSEPKSKTWQTLAEFYGVSVEYLMGLSNDPTPSADRNPNLNKVPPATGLDLGPNEPSYIVTPRLTYQQLINSISMAMLNNPGLTDELKKWELKEKLASCSEAQAQIIVQKIQQLLLDEFNL